jgi:hypothetical protein
MRRNYTAHFFLNQSEAEDLSDGPTSRDTSFIKIVPHFGALKIHPTVLHHVINGTIAKWYRDCSGLADGR